LPCLFERALDGARTRGANKFAPSFLPKKQKEDFVSSTDSQVMNPLPFHHSIFCLLLVFAGGAFAQEAPPKLIQNPRILYSSTVRNADGGTTTFQRIEPPTAAQLAALQPAPLVSSAPAVPLPPILSVTARVYEGTLTEIKWLHNGVECRAWSSIDFRLLEAIPQFEHDGVTRRLMSITMTHRQPPAGVVLQRPWPAFPAEVLAAVPEGMRAWYVLMEYPGAPQDEAVACAPLDALHAYVEANWEALHERRVQREAQKVKEAAYKAAHPEPPPAPQDVIIQFWKEEQP
jgi:hypothetical protein